MKGLNLIVTLRRLLRCHDGYPEYGFAPTKKYLVCKSPKNMMVTHVIDKAFRNSLLTLCKNCASLSPPSLVASS